MVCTLINPRNAVKLFVTQVEQRVTGKWFHGKIVNFLTSFLWLMMRVQTLKIVVDLFFKITLTVLMSISIDVSQQIAHMQEREKQIVPP